MSRQKIQSFSEDRKVLRSYSRSNSVKIKERNAFRNKHMSPESRDFIQKICYRKTASIDMTRHGFISDSKVDPVKYMMKRLRAQLEKICVKPAAMAVKRDIRKHYSPGLPRAKLRDAVTSPEREPSYIPKSALSCPGTRSSRNRRRVRIQSVPNPSPEVGQKKVKVVSPKNKR